MAAAEFRQRRRVVFEVVADQSEQIFDERVAAETDVDLVACKFARSVLLLVLRFGCGERRPADAFPDFVGDLDFSRAVEVRAAVFLRERRDRRADRLILPQVFVERIGDVDEFYGVVGFGLGGVFRDSYGILRKAHFLHKLRRFLLQLFEKLAERPFLLLRIEIE